MGLGSCPSCFRVSVLTPNSRKKGTLVIKRLLRNLGVLSLHSCLVMVVLVSV